VKRRLKRIGRICFARRVVQVTRYERGEAGEGGKRGERKVLGSASTRKAGNNDLRAVGCVVVPKRISPFIKRVVHSLISTFLLRLTYSNADYA
jgi:hypothetical protein